MRIRNLNTFLAVARLGSFHAAASQLHASQPAISARVAALEEELGVQLFSRDKSGTRLTPRGTQLLPYAERLVAISREMKAQLQDDAPERGNLRIGIVDTLAHLWLPQLLSQWQRQHPLLAYELRSDATPELIEQLHQSELDLVLMVANDQALPEFVIEPLCSYRQFWVGNTTILAESRISDLASLAHHPILSFPRNTRPWRYLQQLFAPLAEAAPVIHTCSSVPGLLTLVEQGVGIALLPEPLVNPALQLGSLQRINLQPEPPDLHFCCAWRLDDDRILPRLLADSARTIVSGHI